MTPRRDLTGQRFTRLAVTCFSHRDHRRVSHWAVRCDCGNELTVPSDRLKAKHTQSCGCLHREGLVVRNTRHGMADKHELYSVWTTLKQRCLNPNNRNYPNYGGRGIKVCDRWMNGDGTLSAFECFLKDVGERPEPELTLDRRNNNGDYEPGNVRWATRTQQAQNKRR